MEQNLPAGEMLKPASTESLLEHAQISSNFVLLYGPPSSGKRQLVRRLAASQRQKLVEITITGDTKEADLLGEFAPCTHKAVAAAKPFIWVKGPLRRAVEKGWWILLPGVDRIRS